MIDKSFYKNIEPISLLELATKLSLKFHGDQNFLIKDIGPLESAGLNEISFYHNTRYKEVLKKTNAGVIIIKESDLNIISDKKYYILSKDPYLTMAQVASIFYPNCDYPCFYYPNNKKKDLSDSSKVSNDVFIHEDAQIGKNCSIGSYVKIGPNVKIGDNCIIGDNVNIYYAVIASNVKIYNGVKIGSEGFGFASNNKIFKKIPQLGRVIIGENVEIGCNSTIDRGSIGDTIISKNTMIDNLVHIAHNVKVGSNTIIAAMTGISGSTEIGNNVLIGGQVGVSGHIKIGDNVKIAAKSGIMKNISDNSNVGGYPATNIIDWHRSTILGRKNDKKK